MKYPRVIDLLAALPTGMSKSHLVRLCRQGGVTIKDHDGWGVLPDDQMKVVNPFMTFKEIYGGEELPDYVRIGRKTFTLVPNPRWEKVTDPKEIERLASMFKDGD